MGTCSKCVRDFRVAPLVFFIDEQYLSARHAGHLFRETESASLASATVLDLRALYATSSKRPVRERADALFSGSGVY